MCLYLPNNTHTLWKNSCSFSRGLGHGTRWTSLPFRNFHYYYYYYFHFISIINGVTLLWTTTVLSDKLDISLRPSKSTGQTQLDVLRDVIRQIFPLFISPVSRVLRIETKISQYNELESKVIQMDGRTFHFNVFKMLIWNK